jgi:ABC-type nitrate/sulfonate/bicarbonate transport system ATPase subunit
METPRSTEPVISVRGIVNRFGAQVVHDGLDMDVADGEVFGIVGGSGSGKSVLLRTILGLQRPQLVEAPPLREHLRDPRIGGHALARRRCLPWHCCTCCESWV